MKIKSKYGLGMNVDDSMLLDSLRSSKKKPLRSFRGAIFTREECEFVSGVIIMHEEILYFRKRKFFKANILT